MKKERAEVEAREAEERANQQAEEAEKRQEEFKEKKCIIKNMVSGEQLTFPLKDLYLRLKEILKV